MTSANIKHKVINEYPNVVKIVHPETGTVIYKGSQRDFYRKYGWPAKPKLQANLMAFAKKQGWGNQVEEKKESGERQ